MDFNKKKLKLIKEVLKSNPRGMTVTTISRAINMNSHSVGRYLEVLAAAGHVDVTVFGRSKVYYLSQRLPVSAMLSLSTDIIIVLDKDLRIVSANEKFFEFTGAKREEIVNRNIEGISFPLKFKPEITPYARGALNGTESNIEADFNGEKGGLHFKIKLIPTVFDDSEKGVTMIFEDITGRKKIEEERSFLAAIVESSNDAIISMTLDGVITSWNTSAERLYSYGADEMRGCSIAKLVSPEGPDEIPGLLEKIKRGERIENYETIRMGKDGRAINVSLTVSPIVDASGSIIGVSSIHHDITRHIESVNALRESEQKFRVLTDSSQVAVIVYMDDAVTYVNPAAIKLSGFNLEDVKGKSFWSFIHPDHSEKMKEYWRARLRGETVPSRYELKIITKDGSIKWVDCSTAYLEYDAKPAVLVSLLDITERKRAEEALRDSEEMFRAFTDSSNAAIIVYQVDTIVYANRAALEISGYKAKDLIGSKILDFIHPDHKGLVMKHWLAWMRGESVPTRYELKVIIKGGRWKWCDTSIALLEYRGKPAMLATMMDITERKMAEDTPEPPA
jgi:PAS domain S-box-containing protein